MKTIANSARREIKCNRQVRADFALCYMDIFSETIINLVSFVSLSLSLRTDYMQLIASHQRLTASWIATNYESHQ